MSPRVSRLALAVTLAITSGCSSALLTGIADVTQTLAADEAGGLNGLRGKGKIPVGLASPAARPETGALNGAPAEGMQEYKPPAKDPRLDAKAARGVAQRYLDRSRDTFEGWGARARLSEEEPLALLDGAEAAPTAYEFLVTDADGGERGYVVVHTSRTRMPVPEVSDGGSGHRAILLARFEEEHGRPPKRPVFYRVSAMSWAVESAEGAITTLSVGGLDVATLKQPGRKRFMFEDQPAYIAAAWEELEPSPYTLAQASTRDLRKDVTPLVPEYDQTRDPVSSCASGCGPVAWTMVYGFHEQRGHEALLPGPASGNTKWRTGLNPVVAQIGRYVNTVCTATKSGATYPDDMDAGARWGTQLGFTVAVGGEPWKRAHDQLGRFRILAAAVDRNEPPILYFQDHSHTRGGNHAVVAVGYVRRFKVPGLNWFETKQARVNMGWGRSRPTTLTLYSDELVLTGETTVSVSPGGR